jgi:hypothetical protein
MSSLQPSVLAMPRVKLETYMVGRFLASNASEARILQTLKLANARHRIQLQIVRVLKKPSGRYLANKFASNPTNLQTQPFVHLSLQYSTCNTSNNALRHVAC